MGEGNIRSLLGRRRAWQRLPRRRRRAMWTFGRDPQDAEEAQAAISFAYYIRSWVGSIEWALGGLLGFAAGVLIATIFGAEQTLSTITVMVWVVVWTAVGVPLRWSRAASLAARSGPDGQ